jgi:hypothetical protein
LPVVPLVELRVLVGRVAGAEELLVGGRFLDGALAPDHDHVANGVELHLAQLR